MLVFGGAGAWCLAPTVAMQVMLDGIAQHKDRFFDYSQLRARASFMGKGNPLLRIHAINAHLKIQLAGFIVLAASECFPLGTQM